MMGALSGKNECCEYKIKWIPNNICKNKGDFQRDADRVQTNSSEKGCAGCFNSSYKGRIIRNHILFDLLRWKILMYYENVL